MALTETDKLLLLGAIGQLESTNRIIAMIDSGGASTSYISRDGSQPPTADQPWGGFKITNLGTPTLAGDAANKSYVDGVVPASTTMLPEGTNLYFTNERAQDAVGNILTDSTDIDFTYDDVGNTISASLIRPITGPFKSDSAAPANDGVLRLTFGDYIKWTNSGLDPGDTRGLRFTPFAGSDYFQFTSHLTTVGFLFAEGRVGLGTPNGPQSNMLVKIGDGQDGIGVNTLSGSFQQIVNIAHRVSSAATDLNACLRMNVRSSTSGTWTTALAAGIFMEAPDLGGGNTVTRYGNMVLFPSTAATNNAAVTDSDTGWTGNYFFNQQGTVPSFLGGQLRVASLGVGNSVAATTLGNVIAKAELFNASGVSVGFLPIYDAIT